MTDGREQDTAPQESEWRRFVEKERYATKVATGPPRQRAIERLGTVREGVPRNHMVLWDGFIRDTVYFPLPLPYSGAVPFPDHADRGAPRPSRVAVDEWRPTSQLRESHKFMTVPYYGVRLHADIRQ